MNKKETKELVAKALKTITKDSVIPLGILNIALDLTAYQLEPEEKKEEETPQKEKIDNPFRIRYGNHLIEHLK